MIVSKARGSILYIVTGMFLLCSSACKEGSSTYKEWNAYGGNSENIKYSALTQIDTANVKKLDVAWTYSSGQTSATNTTDMKTNAIVVDGTLYGLNPQLKLFALDAATGKEKWVYDPGSV